MLVRHVRCAEHGDLIEVGRERAIVATTSYRNSPAELSDASSTDVHGHEHCLIAPMRRDRLGPDSLAVLDSAHVDAYGTIGLVHDDEVAPPIAVIVLAPKNSPPLA